MASLFVSSATAFRDVFALPVTGTYTITVDPRDQQTGSLTFLIAVAPSGLTAGSSALLTLAGVETDIGDLPATFTTERASEMVLDAAGSVTFATAATPELTIAVADVLANDRPGPANEASQSLTVTTVSSSPFTHGAVTFANGVITYVPDADFVGAASFVYTACDNGTTDGAPDPKCSTVQVVVIVTANHPPVVAGQHVTTAEETPVQISLTGSDPDGDPIVFVVGAPGRGTITGVPPPSPTHRLPTPTGPTPSPSPPTTGTISRSRQR